MLDSSQILKARTLLEESNSPFFLYDNDADGLCSFVLLRRWLGKGTGSAVRSHPDLDAKYAHQAISHGADLVVVLDRPFLGDDFLQELAIHHIPVLWIDHHDVESPHRSDPMVHNLNPRFGKKSSHEPVTHWCYKIAGRKKDFWIALMGCIADHYLPSYNLLMNKEYAELWKKVKGPFEGYYTTELGYLARMIGFSLKDMPSHVRALETFLFSCNNPYELIEEFASGDSFSQTARSLHTRYKILIERALLQVEEPSIFFSYRGDSSMSSELANELSFRFPKSYIAVVYLKQGIVTLSLRGLNVRKLFDILMTEFPCASGGGHRDAMGVRLPSSDLEGFKERFLEHGRELRNS